jgi:hypothetical protein
MQWRRRRLIVFMHISSLLKIPHHLTYFFPASTFFWAASCLSAPYHRQQMGGTYNLSLSGLELLLGSLELFLLPLSDVLTLLGLFSLAVLLARHYTTDVREGLEV